MSNENNNSEWKKITKSFGIIFNIGYYISASVIIGLFLGYQIDKYFNTLPLFTILMIICGIIAGILEIIKLTKY